MKRVVVILAGLLVLVPALSFAQDPSAAPPAEGAVPVPAVAGAFLDTFLFNPGELATIEKAVKGKVTGTSMLSAQNQINIPKKRVIALAGVVYKSDDDWIVWINGHKITPGQLLPEIIEIGVKEDIVRMKWFDIGLNGIISITLRPHQTYDIVTGVLLPG